MNLKLKNDGFAAKFKEWYIENPDECCGEMNFVNDENDIRLSVKKCMRMRHAGYRIFMNVFCVLAGIAIIAINAAFYMRSVVDFNIYYSDTSFAILMVVGILVMFLPVYDMISDRRKVRRKTDLMLKSGSVNISCGCRFFNNRVEFISCCEHMIYKLSDIENIYECCDGLYFMMYSGGFRYIPSRFFDREFAYMVTERLSVICFEKYDRREYMHVSETADSAPEFEFPSVEPEAPSFELNYIIDRPSVKRFTGCGRMKLGNLLQIIVMGMLGIAIAYSIFIQHEGTVLNWGILVLDIMYVTICVALHFSEVELECDRYGGQYLIRFFDEHLSIVSENSVKKIDYYDIYSIEPKDGCVQLKTCCTNEYSLLIIPMYAMENTDMFVSFVTNKCPNNQ